MDERYLPAPDIAYGDAKLCDFDRVWRAALANGGEIAYDLPHPKHEFLCWLGERQDVVLHGSNEMDISEFSPRRAGFDANPHGNHRAIYATNDGIWPMFFAVLDKRRYRGSMRNGVLWVDDSGRELDFTPDAALQGGRKMYLFSLNVDELPSRPWREAMVYILPRWTFEQLRDGNGVLIAEWASREPVRPLARLRVRPEDFPFVDRVSGHDDTDILRTQELLERLIRQAHAVRELDDGYSFERAWDEEACAEAEEFSAKLRAFTAAAEVTVAGDREIDALCVSVRGPEALKDALTRRVHEYRPAR